jgi:hypothetical protein
MPAECGGGNSTAGRAGGLAYPDMPCYAYNEATGRFAFWGRNSALRLVHLP